MWEKHTLTTIVYFATRVNLEVNAQCGFFLEIGHFTVVYFVTWPWIRSEAGVDLVLIQTSVLLICKCKVVSIRTACSAYEKQ